MKRLPLTVSVLMLACVALRAEGPSVKGTLPEDYLPGLVPLLKTGVEHSPNTILANITLAQQEGQKYQAQSGLYPSLSGTADYAVNRASETNTASNTSSAFFYNIGISQPLFQWNALANNARIGTLGLRISERQYAEAYRLLAAQIREQYMAVITKKVALRNARFAQKVSEENVAAQQAKFESGSSSQAELQTFKIRLETDTLVADRAQEDFEYTKRVLTRLVGIDDLADDAIPLELPHPEYSAALADTVLAGFVGNGIESTFQSEVYDMYIKQQDLTYAIAKVRLLPKFSANAGYSLANTITPAGGRVVQNAIQSESYSVVGSWSIFDGFATRGAKLSALASKRYYEQLKKNYTDQTVDQIHYLRHQVGFSARSQSMAEVQYALLDAQIKRLNQDLQLGYASQATIDTGLLTLYATEFNMVYQRSDYLGRWTDFISLAGIDPALDNLPSRYVK